MVTALPIATMVVLAMRRKWQLVCADAEQQIRTPIQMALRIATIVVMEFLLRLSSVTMEI
jgi:hypothetical protein